jgi:hypothetical protein
MTLIGQRFLEAFDLDRGFLFTVAQLTRNPARAVEEYLGGRSSRYTDPARYLLISAAITTAAMLLLGVNHAAPDGLQAGWEEALPPWVLNTMEVHRDLTARYFNLFALAVVPFIAAGTLLFFRRSGRTYPEHLVFNAFTYAHVSAIIVLAMLGLHWMGVAETASWVFVMGWIVYWTTAAARFFDTSLGSAAVRCLVATTLASTALSLTSVAAIALYLRWFS